MSHLLDTINTPASQLLEVTQTHNSRQGQVEFFFRQVRKKSIETRGGLRIVNKLIP